MDTLKLAFPLVALVASLAPALAQQPKPLETVTLTVTVNELGIIGRALDERPHKEVAQLLRSLQQQFDAQVAKANAPEPQKDEPK